MPWSFLLQLTFRVLALRPYPVIILQVVLAVLALVTNGGGGASLEIHGYQKEFLGKMAKAQGMGSEGAALQSIVYGAMSNAGIKSAIFDDFHCVHCGSKNPPDWVKNGMGKTVSRHDMLHLGCILPRVTAISLRTGYLPRYLRGVHRIPLAADSSRRRTAGPQEGAAAGEAQPRRRQQGGAHLHRLGDQGVW